MIASNLLIGDVPPRLANKTAKGAFRETVCRRVAARNEGIEPPQSDRARTDRKLARK
jgi:hypothetical protein